MGLLVYAMGLGLTAVQGGLNLALAVLETALLFSLAGAWVGLRASDWTEIAWPAELVVRPLFLLGGVFVPVRQLDQFWQGINLWNPCYYLVQAAQTQQVSTTLAIPLLLLPPLVVMAMAHLGATR